MVFKHLANYLVLALIAVSSFILSFLFFSSSLPAILMAALITLLAAGMIGYFTWRSQQIMNKRRVNEVNLAAEKQIADAIEMKGAQINLALNQLAQRVSNIANSLGQTSGYMDNLTYQTEVKSHEISNSFSQVVEGTSQESVSIQQVAKQLEMMSSAIDGIASGAQNQAQSVQTASSATSKVNQAIEAITQQANIAAEASAKASKAANEGGKTIKETVAAIKSIKEKVGDSAAKVREMGARSSQIGEIVGKIKDIADQTNLLALNAAIEAARAGEMGRGFAVVASEVRKLAENSVLAAQEVNELVLSIQSSVQEAILTMDKGVQEVENGVGWAEQSGLALESIISTSEIANKGLKDVVDLTQQQIELSSELSEAMESVSAVVEENSATTEEMAAQSNDISVEMRKISEISMENNNTAIEVAKITDEISSLAIDATASAQTLAEMASFLQNVAAANSTNDTKTSVAKPRTRKPEDKPTIGIVVPKTNLFWKAAVEFATKAAEELGIHLIVRDAQYDKATMEKFLDELIASKVDGLLWVPYFGLGQKGLIRSHEAGIPILLIDSYVSGLHPQSHIYPNYRAFVGPADETGAYEMCEYLLAHLPFAKDGKKYIAALDGTEGSASAFLRHKGLLRAIKDHPEAVLVDSRKANFDVELGKQAMAAMLAESPHIQGVWGAGDNMVLGAIEAAKDAKRTPGKDILFVGMDLDRNSQKAVRSGEQLFDIGGHWLQLGFGLSILYDELNGFPYPKGRSIVKLPLLPLTQDKVDQFEIDFPNGIPAYDFKQKSRAYNPEAPIAFFEMKYSNE